MTRQFHICAAVGIILFGLTFAVVNYDLDTLSILVGVIVGLLLGR